MALALSRNSAEKKRTIEDGYYWIRCNTEYYGNLNLQGSYYGNGLSMQIEAVNQDQIFHVEWNNTKSKYKISCNTRAYGIKLVRVHYRLGIIKLGTQSDECPEKLWDIKLVGDNKYHIICETRYGGIVAVEAYPRLNDVKPRIPNISNQDQLWEFKIVPDNIISAVM